MIYSHSSWPDLYSWYPVDHCLIDDDGNIVGIIPKPKEIPISDQKFTNVNNVKIYSDNNIKKIWEVY